jgi:hypothetical protein
MRMRTLACPQIGIVVDLRSRLLTFVAVVAAAVAVAVLAPSSTNMFPRVFHVLLEGFVGMLALSFRHVATDFCAAGRIIIGCPSCPAWQIHGFPVGIYP